MGRWLQPTPARLNSLKPTSTVSGPKPHFCWRWRLSVALDSEITHTMSDILRASVFAIACGYPDADDLRRDPPFKVGLPPKSIGDLSTEAG
jgi:hypothetical protein